MLCDKFEAVHMHNQKCTSWLTSKNIKASLCDKLWIIKQRSIENKSFRVSSKMQATGFSLLYFAKIIRKKVANNLKCSTRKHHRWWCWFCDLVWENAETVTENIYMFGLNSPGSEVLWAPTLFSCQYWILDNDPGRHSPYLSFPGKFGLGTRGGLFKIWFLHIYVSLGYRLLSHTNKSHSVWQVSCPIHPVVLGILRAKK